MTTHEKGRHGLAAAALALVLGIQAAGTAGAASCMDELDRFERRLHDSGLAATDPQRFQALVRQAQETAELRDEEQCLQSVAELNAELPDDSGVQSVNRGNSAAAGEDAEKDPRRPAAPVLMIAEGDESQKELPDEDLPDDEGEDNTEE